MKLHYFIATLLFFSWKKTLLPKHFFFCLVSGTVKFMCPSCVCRYSQACEFPLRFTSLFLGSLKPKHKIFSKNISSLVGKASPTALTSRCHPLSFGLKADKVELVLGFELPNKAPSQSCSFNSIFLWKHCGSF